MKWHGFDPFTLTVTSGARGKSKSAGDDASASSNLKATMTMHPDLIVHVAAGGVASRLTLDMFPLCIQEYKARDAGAKKFDMCVVNLKLLVSSTGICTVLPIRCNDPSRLHVDVSRLMLALMLTELCNA